MAKVFGTFALRLADDTVLPFDFRDYASAIQSYLNLLINATNLVDFTPMKVAIQHFVNASQSVESEKSGITSSTAWGIRRALNDRLMLTERSFLGTAVESGKEWYYHIIYAPSDYNSYGGVTFPAIYKALASGDLNHTDFVVKRIAQIIDEAATFLQGGLFH